MPYNVTISDAANSNGSYSGANPDVFSPTGDNAVATTFTIENDLAQRRSVTVVTGSGGGQSGDITVVNALNDGSFGSTSPTLTLSATRSIALNASSFLAGSNLVLSAGGDVVEAGGRQIRTQTLSVNAGGAVSLASPSNAITALAGLTAGGDASLASSSSLTIGGAVTVGANNVTLSTSAGAALNQTAAASLTAANATYVAGGDLNLAQSSNVSVLSLTTNGALTLTGATAVSRGMTVQATGGTISGQISGAGSLNTSVGGTLVLSASNSYSGGTTLSGGTLEADTAGALGSGAVTFAGGALRANIAGGGTLANPLVIGVGGSATISNSRTGEANAVQIGGSATSIGDNSTLHLGTTSDTGVLLIAISGSAGGGRMLSVDFGVARAASVSLAQITSGGAGTTTVAAGAVLDYASFAGGINRLVGGGYVQQDGGVLTIRGGLFSGVIRDGSAAVSLSKTTTDTLTLSGASTYTGGTTVAAGVLAVDGSVASGMTVRSGATLRGTGASSGAVTIDVGGTFAPGEGTGIFTSSTLRVAGDFAETINSPSAFAQAKVTAVAAGVVNLGGSLNLTYTGGAEAYLTAYKIIDASGGGTIAGTFSNAADGSTIISNGHVFRVNYNHSDVTLTDVTNSAPTIAAGQSFSAPENQTAVGQAQASDPDGGDSVSGYVLAGAGADNALFNISPTGVLSFRIAPDYESMAHGPAYQVTVTASDTRGGTSAPTAVTVNVANVNEAPALGGSGGSAVVTDKATARPLVAVTVADPDAGDVQTATVGYTAANGSFAGLGAVTTANGVASYTVSGTAAQVQAQLQAAVFTPTANQVAPGQQVTTTFTVTDRDAGGLPAAQPATASVTALSVNDPPALAGAMGGQTVSDRSTINPFAAVTVNDPDVGQAETGTVSFDGAYGTLSGGGFTATAAPGVYTVTAVAGGGLTAAQQAQADLRAAVFTPTQAGIGTPPTQTSFIVSVSDGAATATLTGAQVTATHTTNTAPMLGGFAAGQTTSDKATAQLFANATVTDPDAQPQTVTVTLSNAANGTLSGGGFAALANAPGSYQVTAASAAAAQADLRALVFTPTPNQVAPGGAGTTRFTVQVNDTQTTTSDSTTTEVVTSVNDTPALSGTHASTTGDRTAVALFSSVTLTDPDVGQTETATISFAAANGTLSGAGTATVANGTASYAVTAGSAAALQYALEAVTFMPTAAPAGSAATQTVVSLSVSDGAATTAADTVVTATHTTNTPVAAANATPAQSTTDKAAVRPFAGVTVTDPDTGQTETAAITYSAANGTLSGAGLTGQAGSYGLSAASAAALQGALQALVFTPTADQVAPEQAVQTAFTVQVGDGASTAQVTDGVTAASVNDAPVVAGVPAAVSTGSNIPVVLAPALTVADADVGAAATGARVAITGGFVAGDVLTLGAPQAGIAASYDTAAGVLTLAGAASDAAYQAALRSVSFSGVGAAAAGARQVGFTLMDDGGAASAPAVESVTTNAGRAGGIGGGSSGGAGASSGSLSGASSQAGLAVQAANLLRAGPADAGDPTSPLFTPLQAAQAIAARLDAGQLGAADAQSALFHLVDGTTSVAEISYAFFTGTTPTQAGLNYLVHSAANPTDLNDAYYARFTTENRYINFAANLATGPGAGAAAFAAAYGSLSLADAAAKAYAAVFGFAADAGKIDAILNAAVSNGLGGTETRAQYFADITGGSLQAQKAAAIGFLLADSVKEGFGAYQQAEQHFLADLAHGTAAFNVDLLAAYGAAPVLVGQPLPDQTLTGG